jgi:hypothetical protein
MSRPQEWRTDVLEGLRQKLRAASFEERDFAEGVGIGCITGWPISFR